MSINQLRDWHGTARKDYHATNRVKGAIMVAETKDRRINTDAKRRE